MGTPYRYLYDKLISSFSKHASSLLHSNVINWSHILASLLHFSICTKHISIYVIICSHPMTHMLHVVSGTLYIIFYVINSSHHFASMLHFIFCGEYISYLTWLIHHIISGFYAIHCYKMWSIYHIINPTWFLNTTFTWRVCSQPVITYDYISPIIYLWISFSPRLITISRRDVWLDTCKFIWITRLGYKSMLPNFRLHREHHCHTLWNSLRFLMCATWQL